MTSQASSHADETWRACQAPSATADKDFKRWLTGIPYEVAFWNSYYANRRRRVDLFRWSLYGKQCRLDNFDVEKFIAGCEDPHPLMLDVGCALSYTFGNIIAGCQPRVQYVDPLAPFYNEILHRHHIDRPDITFGMIESLSVSYPPGSATLIHVRNALDHCSDPMEGIIQCLHVLKVGGVLYLNHFVNEAEREAYRGFHRFNICDRQGHLHIWNPDSDTDVTERLSDFATVTTGLTPEGRLTAVITKTAPVPESMSTPTDTAASIARRMMATVEYFHTAPHAMSYQRRRLTSTIAHRFMRMLPFGAVRRLKSLLAHSK